MKNLIAIGVLVVLGIAAYFTMKEEPNTEQEKVKEVISPIDTAKVDTIKVERLDGFGDKKTPEKYTLEKKGDTWRMTEPVDFAVVASTVESMLKVMGEFRAIDVISEKKASHEKFAVDDRNGVKVKALAGDKALVDIIIGNAKGGVTFARLPGKDEVYRMKGSFKFNLDRSIKTLREKGVMLVETDDIEKVTFTQGESSLTFVKTEGEDFAVKPEGQEIRNFDDKKAASLVRSAARLNAVDFIDEKLPTEKTGLDDTADKYVIVGKKDDKPYTGTVYLGRKVEDKGQVYAKSADSDQIYLISNYTADRLRAKAADFVKEEKKDDKKAATPKPPTKKMMSAKPPMPASK